MNKDINRKPFILFNVLVTYVLVQLIWWAYLILSIMHQVYGESDVFHKKIAMIIGEGSVFIILLVIGIIVVRRMFRKELWLNQQQRNFLLHLFLPT